MRTAYFDKQWIYDSADGNENGDRSDLAMVGLCLGFDHCAEHEWGIGMIEAKLGVGKKAPNGIERRQITQVPDAQTLFFKRGTVPLPFKDGRKVFPYAILSFNDCIESRSDRLKPARLKNECPFYSGKMTVVQARELMTLREVEDSKDDAEHNQTVATQGLVCRWGSEGFEVVAYGPSNVERLEVMHQAILAGDCCVSLSGQSMPFAGSGLCLTIASRISPTTREEVLAADLDHATLLAAASATGVEEALKAAGKRYYALAPKWANKEKTDVVFWLNPMEQRQFKYGWFSADDLHAWARDEGPIMMDRTRSGTRPGAGA